MTACDACLHFSECMERRGKCKEYKDLEEVKRDIEMLNQKAKSTACSKADKADNRQGSAEHKSPFGSEARETACNRGEPQEAQDAIGGNDGISTEAVRGEAAAESGSGQALGKRDVD